MEYTFICNRCLRRQVRSIPVDKYDEEKDKQVCSFCTGNTKMERVIEFDGGIKLSSGMYGTGKNGWNK